MGEPDVVYPIVIDVFCIHCVDPQATDELTPQVPAGLAVDRVDMIVETPHRDVRILVAV